MKQAFVKAGSIVMSEVPVPACQDAEVLVANAFSVISSGTELATIKSSSQYSTGSILKNWGLIKRGIQLVFQKGLRESLSLAKQVQGEMTPLGYSSAGVVVQVGRLVTDVEVGDRVACAGGGKANHAEVVAVPRNLVAKVPQGVELVDASYTTVGIIAMHGLRRLECQFGSTVVILGTGLIGMLAVVLARAAGYRVVAVDTMAERVQLAQTLGADLGVQAEVDDVEAAVLRFSQGQGADGVLVCASTPSSALINQGMRMARKKGTVVVVGDVGLEVERKPFYAKELDLLMSRSYGPGRYDPQYEEKGLDYPLEYVRWSINRNMQAFLQMLQAQRFSLTPLRDQVYPIDQVREAYEYLGSHRATCLSTVIQYTPDQYITRGPSRGGEVPMGAVSAVSAGIRIGMVGTGNYARSVLLPIFQQNPAYRFHGVVSATGGHAAQVRDAFRFQYCSTEYGDLLGDAAVDLVVIATPHHLHFPMVMEALAAGKPVFVEKPLCLSGAELAQLEQRITETSVPVYVGFNRRYAPITQKLQTVLATKPKPFFVNYRVNTSPLPADHWIHDPEVGGGRLIGEGCHFLDYFQYLIGTEPQEIAVEVMPVNGTSIPARDNFAVTVKWACGSLSTLLYSSLGHPQLPKERLEISAGQGTVVVKNFQQAMFYGFDEPAISLNKVDKGHTAQFQHLAQVFQGHEAYMIPIGEAIRSMALTFEVDRLSRQAVPPS